MGAGEAIDGKVFVEIRYSNRLNPTRPPQLSLSGVIGPTRNGNLQGQLRPDRPRQRDVAAVRRPDRCAAVEADRDLGPLAPERSACRLTPPGGVAAQQPGHRLVPRVALRQGEGGAGEAGLQPDAEHLIDGEPYSYGSAWLHEELPDEVLDFLRSLPECSITYPWQNEFDRNTP